MIAILQVLTKRIPHLVGRKFHIVTDYRGLKYFLDQRVANPAQQKWVSELMGCDYEVVYRAGHEIRVADALSRTNYN